MAAIFNYLRGVARWVELESRKNTECKSYDKVIHELTIFIRSSNENERLLAVQSKVKEVWNMIYAGQNYDNILCTIYLGVVLP